MISKCSKIATSYFLMNGIVDEKDREVYEYGMELLLATLVNFFVVCTISIIAKKQYETIFYLLGFLPLRALAGGYHAKSHTRCLVTLVITYLLFLLLVIHIPIKWITPTFIISLLVGIITIFVLSPVEDENKPLSIEENKRYRIKSRTCIIAICMAGTIFFFITPHLNYPLSLSLGILTVALSLVTSIVKKSFKKRT